MASVRELFFVFASTEYSRVALPVPELGDFQWIQPGRLEADHLQVSGPVITTLPLPALELKVWLVGEIVNAQAPPA